MIETAKLTINLSPELRDCLLDISEKKQVNPSSLAAELLQCCLRKEACRANQAEASKVKRPERRRHGQGRHKPAEIVADIQQTLENLGDYLPGFSPEDPLAAEVEAIISQVEAERGND